MKYEERCNARDFVVANFPDLAPVFSKERDPWPEEVRGEPFYLCGIST